MSRSPSVAALVLAAGAGRRMGGPKALLRRGDGRTWVEATIDLARTVECQPIVVVSGAEQREVETAVRRADAVHGQSPIVVHAADWAEGMGASLRAGLRGLERSLQLRPVGQPGPVGQPWAVLVLLVDTPGLTPPVLRRVVDAGAGSPNALIRAVFDGQPGHPVLIGRDHWSGVVQAASGDRGARDYLAQHAVRTVECADLADGRDIDSPDQFTC